jgi:hypothetical protein
MIQPSTIAFLHVFDTAAWTADSGADAAAGTTCPMHLNRHPAPGNFRSPDMPPEILGILAFFRTWVRTKNCPLFSALEMPSGGSEHPQSQV